MGAEGVPRNRRGRSLGGGRWLRSEHVEENGWAKGGREMVRCCDMARGRHFLVTATKAVRILLVVVFCLLFLTFLYHKYEICWQCGAVRHVFLTTWLCPNLFVEEGIHSHACEQILGEPCPHAQCAPGTKWIFFAHADYLVPVPVNRTEAVELTKELPELQWQREALLAVGAKDNLLKWVGTAILHELKAGTPDTPEKWSIWWGTNKEVFTVVTDRQKARQIAQRAAQRISDIDAGGWTVQSGIAQDLGEPDLFAESP